MMNRTAHISSCHADAWAVLFIMLVLVAWSRPRVAALRGRSVDTRPASHFLPKSFFADCSKRPDRGQAATEDLRRRMISASAATKITSEAITAAMIAG